MHMPLFATAASMYDMVPVAPPIVALDEAMDGIDDRRPLRLARAKVEEQGGAHGAIALRGITPEEVRCLGADDIQ